MNRYLKLFLATAIPFGISTGTALSASAEQVRIELLDVRCGNTEDVTGADEFYIVGALSDGTNTKGVLTSPFDINDGQSKSFDPAQQVIFDANVPEGQTVRGGLKAFDEDFAKDWAEYGSTVNKITDTVAAGLAATGDPRAVTASTILNYGVKGFGFFASLDKDDELGKLELNVPVSGPSVEEKKWKFSRSDWTGYSSWNYTVRYRITRTGDTAPAQFQDGALLKGSGPEVYIMQAGQRRWIPNPETFNALGLDWNAIQTIPDADLEAIPRGPDQDGS